MNWRRVQASREGLVGKVTAAGLLIRPKAIFVALPARQAVWKIVAVKYANIIQLAPVLDVGPWNEDDIDYVFGLASSLASQGIGKYRKPTNKAGIDLSDGLIVNFYESPDSWGLKDVEWTFVNAGDLNKSI